MEITTQRPEEGQFGAYWEYEGKIWAETFRWNNGALEISFVDSEGEEGWSSEGTSFNKSIVFTYVVLEDQLR